MQAVFLPWLHMHQPLIWLGDKLVSNLEKMVLSSDSRESWDGRLIARAYKNPAKYVEILKKSGHEPRIALDFSGILLESLQELGERGFLDKIEVSGERVGDIIACYKKVLKRYPECIEFAGTAYAHSYFPVIPREDYRLQVEEWRNVFGSLFGDSLLKRVKGFWLPEMGVPKHEENLKELIKVLCEQGYEWCILPLQAVEGYERMSYTERIETIVRPWKVSCGGEEIKVVFRAPTYFIDQQAGVSAEEVYSKCLEAGKLAGEKPALVITASDGENGNVMMNEFFPQFYKKFFMEKLDEKVGSMLVSEFLDKFYQEELEEIKLKSLGASWIDGHALWIEGSRRERMVKKLYELSEKFHSLHAVDEKTKKLFLVAETSCYNYWGTDFWFDQGERTIEAVLERFNKIKE